jgi:DNA-directed RNA polymerase specialized sigma24 family protein
MMLDESRRDVRAAFGRLDAPCREIITVLVLADPPVPYEVASERLGRPIGSLGPSRRRCLQKMKSLLEGDATDPPIDHRGAS